MGETLQVTEEAQISLQGEQEKIPKQGGEEKKIFQGEETIQGGEEREEKILLVRFIHIREFIRFRVRSRDLQMSRDLCLAPSRGCFLLLASFELCCRKLKFLRNFSVGLKNN